MTPRPNPEEPPAPPRVSVVVVSCNRIDRLRACLEALEKSQGRERLQIIVVDNGSRDGSAQLENDFPNTQFFKLPKNFGLTKAMNIGWRAAEAEYIFFLHEDTEVEPDAENTNYYTVTMTGERALAHAKATSKVVADFLGDFA